MGGTEAENLGRFDSKFFTGKDAVFSTELTRPIGVVYLDSRLPEEPRT